MWLLKSRLRSLNHQISDGTVEILQLRNYVDSIGLTGWNIDEAGEAAVLADLRRNPTGSVLFGNDRIDVP
ncbi:hypothetical protein BV898_19450 [Hypsibius exemplaris]|uniref:Uncharacterized protein n=1 Tax=Hypsibius exemplaris TaxID=2072580 RepID=A0A9X6NIZ8_HYPEX|nr:hypothetical protein BV898_19450 [Hypsibius exemplaris]